MEIAQVAAVGVLSAILAITIKKQSPEMALLITITASILIFCMILPMLTEAIGVLRNVGDLLNTNIKHISLILKVLGIAYVAELGAQICADAGEGAIASKIELAGKVFIVVLAAPVLLDLINMIMGIMP